MPASSKAQQKFMGIVHSLQKGDIKPSDVSKSVKDAAKSMSKKDAKDFASTPHKGLPKKVKLEIVKRLKEYANKMGLDHLGGDSIPSNKKRGGLRDFDGYDNVDYNKDMPMDEAYIVLHSPKKGQKPVATAAYRDKKDAQKWEKDLKKKKGGITMIVQKKVKGVDESVVKEAGMIPKLYSAFVGLKFKVKGLEEDQLKMLKQFKSEKDTNKKKALLDKMKKATVVLKKQRGYLSNLEADWLNKLDTVIKELAVTEGGLPQNWMAGRVSDYHTKLRGKKRKYDDTNFAKTNTGQPDIPEEEKDDEIVNETKPLLKKVKLEIVKRLKEYASRLSNAYILDDESILKGTPEPKDAIKREVSEETKRDYKDEYKKFQSSTKSKKYRAELNKYNRDKNTYGNGDGKDASHKGGKIVGFEAQSKNRSRKEKSRLKK